MWELLEVELISEIDVILSLRKIFSWQNDKCTNDSFNRQKVLRKLRMTHKKTGPYGPVFILNK